MNVGKLLILSMIAVALLLAGFSWWFRFQATHRAAQFWGPSAAQLIRDAPTVYVWRVEITRTGGEPPGVNAPAGRNVASAPGMTHLRTALLEDRSFDWDEPFHAATGDWEFVMQFGTGDHHLQIWWLTDCKWMVGKLADGSHTWIACSEPIGKGLKLVLDEHLDVVGE